jgi:enamine deaminase RidA (YjgF/YER057c/UK114 family)
MKRVKISSGAKWESIVGYSRAIRAGSHVYVSGTTAFNQAGQIEGIGNPYLQTIQILKTIKNALEDAGSAIDEVVRTRIYVSDISHWPDVGRAHSDFFKDINPATTMVEVSRLIEPEILVEIEADAFVDD